MPTRLSSLALILTTSLVAAAAGAQTPFLARDLTVTGTQSSGPGGFYPQGDRVLFTAWTPATGRELWSTDGTAQGTRLVKDINPGALDASPVRFFAVNGVHVFLADDGVHGLEPWRTDGTPEGTYALADIRAGSIGSVVQGSVAIVVADGWAYFIATTGGGLEDYGIWRTDGTAANTTRVATLASAQFGAPGLTGAFGGWVLFAQAGSDTGMEPWRLDTTTMEASLLKDIVPGTVGSAAQFAPVGGRLFAAASTPEHGYEPWVSDGTSDGTVLLADLQPGTESSNPSEFVGAAGGFCFAATVGGSRALVWTDGTPGSFRVVRDGYATFFGIENLTPYQNGVLFFANDGVHGREPWFSDGTAEGTYLLRDLVPGASGTSNASGFQFLDGLAHFFGSEIVNGAARMWTTDGTPAGTAPWPGTVTLGGYPVDVLGRRYVSASTAAVGSEPFLMDGSPTGASLLVDLAQGNTGSTLIAPVAAGGRLGFFSRVPGSSGVLGLSDLWFSDGTAAAARLTAPATPPPTAGPSPEWRQTYGDSRRLLFSAATAGGSQEPWVFDFVTGEARLLLDIFSGAGASPSYPHGFTRVGDRVCFVAEDSLSRRFLYSTDGTTAGTAPLVPLSSPQPPAPERLTAVGDRLVFISGSDVWSSDGTAAGTTAVGRGVYLSSFDDDMTPDRPLAVLGGSAYFMRNGGPAVNGLWRTDGTAAGTALAVPLSGPLSGRENVTLASSGARLFFAAPGPAGSEPWVSDGTPGGTRMCRDVAAGLAPSNPHSFVPLGSRALFYVSPPIQPSGVWATDGTAAGTVHLGIPTTAGNTLPRAAVAHGRAYFVAGDAQAGRELWVSDGTLAGTRRLTDLRAGRADTRIDWVQAVNSRVYFAADDGAIGLELWAVDACAADWDNSGATDLGDLFAFLAGWFPSDPRTDFDGSGGAPDTLDVFAFLSAWFSGCA